MPDVSVAMADEKIRALEESGADTLISGDSSCLMHLKGRLRRTNHDTRVYHLAQVLDGAAARGREYGRVRGALLYAGGRAGVEGPARSEARRVGNEGSSR